MEAGNKRKRDLDCPRITYHAPDRTFDRLFREESLKELKEVARKKLGLALDVTINLSQIRGDKYIDLEDEDDFDAFCNALLSLSTADVRVTIEKSSMAATSTGSKSRELQQAPGGRKKRKLNDPPPLSPPHPPDAMDERPSGAGQSSGEGRDVEPPAKRLKGAPAKPPKQSAELVESSVSRLTEAPMEGDASAKAKKVPATETTQTGNTLPLISALLSALHGSGQSVSTSKSQDGTLSTNNAKMSGAAEKESAKTKKAKTSTSLGDAPVIHTYPISAENDEPKPKKRKPKEKSGLADKRKKSAAQTQQPIEMIAQGAPSASPMVVPGPSSGQHLSQPARGTSSLPAPDGPVGHGDTIPKTRKSRLATAKDPVAPANATVMAKPKKKEKSKPKEREATSTESETTTNDAVTEPSLADISRLMIEKYLNPSSAVGSDQTVKTKAAGDSQVIKPVSVQPTQSVLTRSKLSLKETCRYCGRVSTHARPHCPVIRASPDSIERRIAELKENLAQDAEGHHASTIKDLEPLLRKKRTAAVKRNLDASSNTLSTEPPAPVGAASSGVGAPTPSIIGTTSLLPRPSPSPSSDDSEAPSSLALKESSLPSYPQTQPRSPRRLTLSENSAQFIRNSDSETSISSEDVSATTSQTDPQSLRFATSDIPDYTDKDLEAVIRGPGIPLRSTELPSTESSEDERPGDFELDNESNENVPPKSRRRRHAVANDSSDEEEGDEEDDEDEKSLTPRTTTPPMAQPGQYLTGSHPVDLPSHGGQTFQQMNDRAGSVEMDKTGDEAFADVFAQENAVFRLADPKPTQGQNRCTASSGPDVPPDLASPNQPQAKGPFRAASHSDLEHGNVPRETAPVRDPEPDPIETVGTPEGDRRRSPIEADDGALPSSREQPARASTPKPTYVQRMRTRTGLPASPVPKSSTSTAALATVPTAKPQSARAATLRSQQKMKTSSQDTAKGPEELKGGNNAGAKRAVVVMNKPGVTRLAAAAAKSLQQAEDTNEEADPPPRRSTRTASKTTASMNPITSHAIRPPLSKRARQISKPTAADAKDLSRSEAEPKEKAKTKKNTETSKTAETTPTQPPVPAAQSTDTSAPNIQAEIQGVTSPPTPPVSLDAWATLPPTTPLPGTQSDPMVDELHSDMDPIPFPLGDEPQYQRKPPSLRTRQSVSRLEQAVQNAKQKNGKGKGKGKEKSSPLFIPSESQDAFPYSQLHTQVATANDSPSDSEEEVRDVVMKRTSEPQPSRYRKLTDFASGAARLFTPKVLRYSTPSVPASEPVKRKVKLKEMYGKMGRESGDEDDSSAGSESEVETVSHIPKSRRAGAGRIPKI